MNVTKEQLDKVAELYEGGDESAFRTEAIKLAKAAGFDVKKTSEYKDLFAGINTSQEINQAINELGGLDTIKAQLEKAKAFEDSQKTAEQKLAELQTVNEQLAKSVTETQAQYEERISVLNATVQQIIDAETEGFNDHQKAIIEALGDATPEKKLTVIRQLKEMTNNSSTIKSPPSAPAPGKATPDMLGTLKPNEKVTYDFWVNRGRDPQDVLVWIKNGMKKGELPKQSK